LSSFRAIPRSCCFDYRWLSIAPRAAGNSRIDASEKIQEFGAAETGLSQDGGNGAGRQITPMYRYDRLTGGIVPVPHKMMRSLAPDDLEASPLQRRDDTTA